MSIKQSIERWATWLLMRQFHLRELNALLGVDELSGLAALLERDDQEAPYRGTRGVHSLRWMLFDPNHESGVASITSEQPQALLFSLICDGGVKSALDAVLQQAGPRVREILSHCRGFGADTDPATYLLQHAITSNYVFRDLGPLVLPPPEATPAPTQRAQGLRKVAEGLRAAVQVAFQQEPDLEPDATLYEIEEAFALRDRFVPFLARHGHESPTELRRLFLEQLGQEGFPLPLTRFERRLPNEASLTRRMIDTALKIQDKSARRAKDHKVRRAIHAKAHGLLHAQFKVLGDPRGVGLFATERTYDAVLRPSNGAENVQRDRALDGRGLALRVLLPPDSRFGSAGERPFLDQPKDLGQGCQDFVLMSSPVFFASDAASLARWFCVRELENQAPAMLAMQGVPGGFRQSLLLYRTMLNFIRHPFGTRYHSASCYAYGPAHVAKYSVEPVDPKRFRDIARQKDPDSLRAALSESLREGPIELHFFVHMLHANAPLAQGLSIQDVVEDATLDWSRFKPRKVHVASIVIPMQDPATQALLAEAEQQQYNPWNSLREHRPLGSLNRARWVVYQASQAHRAAKRASSTAEHSVSHAAE